MVGDFFQFNFSIIGMHWQRKSERMCCWWLKVIMIVYKMRGSRQNMNTVKSQSTFYQALRCLSPPNKLLTSFLVTSWCSNFIQVRGGGGIKPPSVRGGPVEGGKLKEFPAVPLRSKLLKRLEAHTSDQKLAILGSGWSVFTLLDGARQSAGMRSFDWCLRDAFRLAFVARVSLNTWHHRLEEYIFGGRIPESLGESAADEELEEADGDGCASLSFTSSNEVAEEGENGVSDSNRSTLRILVGGDRLIDKSCAMFTSGLEWFDGGTGGRWRDVASAERKLDTLEGDLENIWGPYIPVVPHDVFTVLLFRGANQPKKASGFVRKWSELHNLEQSNGSVNLVLTDALSIFPPNDWNTDASLLWLRQWFFGACCT